MANLIPRKQIEEQQNISSSFTIGQDLFVGNDVIVSGSLFVSKSFFLGTDTGSKSEITGSVYLTGSLNIDGNLNFVSPQAILALTSSNALQSVNTTLYEGIRSRDFGANVPTLYVSSTDGDDNNDGRSIQYPLRTIKRASLLATPGYDGRYGLDSGSKYNGYVIKVQAGTYLEDNPVILPKNSSIWGSGLRITKILAKNKNEDLFWVNSGCYVAEVTVGGLQLYPNQINPEKGFGFAFQPGAFITTSPYIQNCSQISNQENSFMELYEDVPPGGGGLYVNGDAVHPDSPLASMVLDAYTQISPNGVGCLVNGRGFIQLVSFFNNFSYYAIRVNNGGHATLNNSNISFGLYGMYASGSRLISGSGGDLTSKQRVRESWSVIVDVLNKGLQDGLPIITTLNTAEGIRVNTTISQSNAGLTNVAYTASAFETSEIIADYNLISAIVENGTGSFPTLLAKSSNKGYGADSPYNILGATQITSSISASASDLTQISASIAATISILGNGTGSFIFKSNNADLIKTTATSPISIGTAKTDLTSSISSSFVVIQNIIKDGLTAKPTLVSNNQNTIYVGAEAQYLPGVSASLYKSNEVSASFSIVYNILANGTGSNIEEIPVDHKREYNVTNVNSSSYSFDGVDGNPTIKLFRGETYKFYVSASEAVGPYNYPLFIRTEPISGIIDIYDYTDGVINSGDSVGNITFEVPYDAPSKLYYVAENSQDMVGTFDIVNSSSTPESLIQNTLTYPLLIVSSSLPKTDIDTIEAYEILTNNKAFIQEEVIEFVNSSWADFVYDEATCRRDVGYIIDGVAKDLLYGGNEESIRAGITYYTIPSEATTTQLAPTTTAVKYAAGMAINLLNGKTYTSPQTDNYVVWDNIRDNKQFVQDETIAFLSSSWTGFDGFNYNETKCRRDIGYILDAVATDVLYGGNERSIQAGEFYYKYPSQATSTQAEQTVTGIRYAAGLVKNLAMNETFVSPNESTLSAYNLLLDNKELIQDETIQYINVAYPSLKYNQTKCRRDVGYIVDATATDLLYGGIERGITSGRYYYNYPSVATTQQKKETIAGVKYAKILADYIVSNQILDTPTPISNTEKGIKVSAETNVTSPFSGSINEQNSISSSFSIIETIIKTGVLDGITFSGNTDNNIKISEVTQFTSANSGSSTEITSISSSFSIVTKIIEGGVSAEPTIISNVENLIKVTDETQYSSSISASSVEVGVITASFNLIRDIIYGGADSLPDSLASNYHYGFELETPSLLHISSTNQNIFTPNYTINYSSSISSSYATIIDIINNGTGSIPTIVENTSGSISLSGLPYQATLAGTQTDINKIGSGFEIVMGIIKGETYPTLVSNNTNGVKVTDTPQLISGSGGGKIQSALISASFSIVADIVANGTGSTTFVSSSEIANTNPKMTSAYDLLLGNKQMIINETIAFVSSSWSTFEYNEASCSRDLGYIIEGAAYDLLYGGNSGSYVNGKYYYDYPSQATTTQLDQTLTAIRYASGLAERVVRNVELTHISASAETSASYSSLLTNKSFIQNETLQYVILSWDSVGFEFNIDSCSRDIGYIVDAVATDLLYGGNERSITAGDYYYRYPSQATNSQLQSTLDGIGFAKGMAMNIANNITFTPFGTDVDLATTAESLYIGKDFIQDETIAFVNAKYPHLYYDETKCRRDVGYIVNATVVDLVYGGNQRAVTAGEFYYKYPSIATDVQLVETTTAIDYARRLSIEVTNGNLIPTPQVIANGTASVDTNVLATYDLLINNKPFIQAETIAFLSSSWSEFDYNQASCSRDIGYLIDAVATDLVYGGNESSANAGIVYFLTASQATDTQLEPTITAIDYVKGLATKLVECNTFVTSSTIISASVTLLRNNKTFIQEETMNYLTASWSTFDYNKVSCSRDLGYIVDAVTTDLLYGGNERSVTAGDFYYKYPSKATLLGDGDSVGQLGQTLDGINYASRIAQKIVDGIEFVSPTTEASASFDLLRKNKKFIAAEVIEYVSSSWSGVYYNEASCSRDVGYLIDAAATDVLYGGTERAITAGNYYYLFPSKATKAGVPSEANQLDPTVTGVRYAGRLATKIVTNPTFLTPSASAEYGRDLLVANKTFIQKETLLFLSSSWSTLEYNEVSCSRDLGFIIDAVATDLIYGGNERSIEAGSYYYKIPSVAIQPSYTDNGKVGQKKQTVDGINYAKGISEKIVNQTQLVFPGTKRKAAYNRLIGAKEELKQKAIGYTNGAFPYLVYNEASCSRDTGLIVDAVATDLLYGGNERGIAAASSYWTGQYGSAQAVVSSQRLETLETNRYLRTRAEFIAAGAPLEVFGSLIVATGIDYSYNGAGVTFKALPPNQGGSGVPNPDYEITQLGGGRIYFTSGNQDGDFRIGTGLSINQATGTLVGRTFSKSLFSLVTPFSLALQI